MKLSEITRLLEEEQKPAQNLKINPNKFKAVAEKAFYSDNEITQLIDSIAFKLCRSDVFRLKELADNKYKYDDKALQEIVLLKDIIKSLENSRELFKSVHKGSGHLRQRLALLEAHELGGSSFDEHINGIKYSLMNLLERDYPAGECGHHKSIYQPLIYRLSEAFYINRLNLDPFNPCPKNQILEREWQLYKKVLRAVFRSLVGLSESEIRSIDKNLNLFKKEYRHYFK